MTTCAFIERIAPFFGESDCVRDEAGRPVIYATYLQGTRSLAESIVESLTIRFADAEEELDGDQKTSLYEDICSGGPISDYHICAVRILGNGTIVDADENVYRPRAPL